MAVAISKDVGRVYPQQIWLDLVKGALGNV